MNVATPGKTIRQFTHPYCNTPYSPDLAPSKYFCFITWKKDSAEKMEVVVYDHFLAQDSSYYKLIMEYI